MFTLCVSSSLVLTGDSERLTSLKVSESPRSDQAVTVKDLHQRNNVVIQSMMLSEYALKWLRCVHKEHLRIFES